MDGLTIALLAFGIVEKIVKLSPCKWDDIVIDGIKSIFILKKK